MRERVPRPHPRGGAARLQRPDPDDPRRRPAGAPGLGPGRGRDRPAGRPARARQSCSPSSSRSGPTASISSDRSVPPSSAGSGSTSGSASWPSATSLGEWVHHDRNHVKQILAVTQARVWDADGQRPAGSSTPTPDRARSDGRRCQSSMRSGSSSASSGWPPIVAIVVRPLRLPYSVALVVVGLGAGLLETVAIAGLRPDVPPEVVLLVLLPGLVFEAGYRLDLTHLRRSFAALLLLAAPGRAHLGGRRRAPAQRDDGSSARPRVHRRGDGLGDRPGRGRRRRSGGCPSRPSWPRSSRVRACSTTAPAWSCSAIAVGALTVPLDPVEAFVAVRRRDRRQRGDRAGGRVRRRPGDGARRRPPDPADDLGRACLRDLPRWPTGSTSPGIIATVVAAIVLGNHGAHGPAPVSRDRRPDALDTVWEFLAYLLTALVFLLVGLAFPIGELVDSLGWIACGVVGTLVGRALVVYLLLGAGARLLPIAGAAWRAAASAGCTSCSGRACAVRLPWRWRSPCRYVPERSLLQQITFGIVLFTLIVQGMTAGPSSGAPSGPSDAGPDAEAGRPDPGAALCLAGPEPSRTRPARRGRADRPARDGRSPHRASFRPPRRRDVRGGRPSAAGSRPSASAAAIASASSALPIAMNATNGSRGRSGRSPAGRTDRGPRPPGSSPATPPDERAPRPRCPAGRRRPRDGSGDPTSGAGRVGRGRPVPPPDRPGRGGGRRGRARPCAGRSA